MRLLSFVITILRDDSLHLNYYQLSYILVEDPKREMNSRNSYVLVFYIRAVIGRNSCIEDCSYPFLFGTEYTNFFYGFFLFVIYPLAP